LTVPWVNDIDSKPQSASSQQRARIAFASAVILLLVSGVIAYVMIGRLLAAQVIVAHTRDVQQTLAQVRTVTSNAALARNRYFDSSDPQFIQDYQAALSRVDPVLQKLRQLTSDNQVQQANCGHLTDTVRDRLTLMSQSIQMKQAGVLDATKQASFSRQIIAAYADMDAILEKMNSEEQRLLAVRIANATQLFRVTVVVLCGAFALALILLMVHYRLLNSELRARQQAERAAADRAHFLDMANDAVFVRSPEGAILYWNEGAERLYGWTKKETVGQSTAALLHTEYPHPLAEITQMLSREGRWEGELVHTRKDGTRITVSSRWTLLRGAEESAFNWLEINTDITEQKRAEESLRLLSARLLQMQDEERRRIARELHDSAGQTLAALGMNLATLEADANASPTASRVVNECVGLVKELTKELRTISHLLHPPLLDEVGISSALPWYVSGFAERSGIKVNLSIPEDFGRLSPESETAIFRVVQESLTNIHRHSGSSVAHIRIWRENGDVALQVRDEGRGIAPDRRRAVDSLAGAGVGIRGMRERIRQLGGKLTINSNGSGTTIVATLPANKTTSFGAA